MNKFNWFITRILFLFFPVLLFILIKFFLNGCVLSFAYLQPSIMSFALISMCITIQNELKLSEREFADTHGHCLTIGLILFATVFAFSITLMSLNDMVINKIIDALYSSSNYDNIRMIFTNSQENLQNYSSILSSLDLFILFCVGVMLLYSIYICIIYKVGEY